MTYSVRSSISRRGQDDGNVKDLADSSMSHDVVLVETWVPVPGNMVEADLDVQNEENGVVLVDTLPRNSCITLEVIIKTFQATYHHHGRH